MTGALAPRMTPLHWRALHGVESTPRAYTARRCTWKYREITPINISFRVPTRSRRDQARRRKRSSYGWGIRTASDISNHVHHKCINMTHGLRLEGSEALASGVLSCFLGRRWCLLAGLQAAVSLA